MCAGDVLAPSASLRLPSRKSRGSCPTGAGAGSANELGSWREAESGPELLCDKVPYKIEE
jgi:hypothetical protein